MSWHFSQALVEAYSQATYSDGELFVPLRSTITPEAYCWRDKMTESLDLFQFGMTSQPSTENLGAELLMWYREGFRASTSVSPEPCGAATESKERKVGSGMNTSESSTKCNLDMFGGKIRQNLNRKASLKSFERFPSEGMFANGQLSELQIADYLMQENVYGFTLPTPTSRDWKDTPGMTMTRKDGKTRADRLPMLLFLCVNSADIKWKQTTDTDARTVAVKGLMVDIKGKQYCPELPEWLMGWPIGWSDLKPLAMDKYQLWLQQHGDY